MPQITVTDEQGNFYFPTYPRRARGLVKKGRARFISANTICLNCPPQNQEEQQMTENTNTSSRTAPTAAEIFAELQQIRQDTVHLGDDTLLKRHKLRRGWVFWKEDISALNQVQKELELTRDELRDTGDVLAAEKAQHARWLKLTEENRLYDMMEAQTARQIAMLRDLLAELQKTEDPDRARHLLGQVIIIGTYIKRRSNLIFVGEQRGAISVQELRLCLNESSENISIYGADCKTVIKGEGRLTVGQATQVYDLFEAVVEAELESLRALLISIEVGKWVEIALCVSGAEPLCGLRTRFPDLEWEQDEDGLQYVTRKLERSRGV